MQDSAPDTTSKVNWIAIVAIVLPLVMAFIGEWSTTNAQINSLNVQVQDLRSEVSRARDRLDKFIDERAR